MSFTASAVHGSQPWRVTKVQLGEVVHHFVDELDVLRLERHAGPGDAGATEDGDVELDSTWRRRDTSSCR